MTNAVDPIPADGGPPYYPGFYVGSEDETGAHIRGDGGWPYSVYRRARHIGVSDAVLCHGIQHREDAEHLLALVNGTPRPVFNSRTAILSWD